MHILSAILFPCYDSSSRLSLTSHLSLQDEKELIRNLASAIGGNEAVLMAEEYLNPGQVSSQAMVNTPNSTPAPKNKRSWVGRRYGQNRRLETIEEE